MNRQKSIWYDLTLSEYRLITEADCSKKKTASNNISYYSSKNHVDGFSDNRGVLSSHRRSKSATRTNEPAASHRVQSSRRLAEEQLRLFLNCNQHMRPTSPRDGSVIYPSSIRRKSPSKKSPGPRGGKTTRRRKRPSSLELHLFQVTDRLTSIAGNKDASRLNNNNNPFLSSRLPEMNVIPWAKTIQHQRGITVSQPPLSTGRIVQAEKKPTESPCSNVVFRGRMPYTYQQAVFQQPQRVVQVSQNSVRQKPTLNLQYSQQQSPSANRDESQLRKPQYQILRYQQRLPQGDCRQQRQQPTTHIKQVPSQPPPQVSTQPAIITATYPPPTQIYYLKDSPIPTNESAKSYRWNSRLREPTDLSGDACLMPDMMTFTHLPRPASVHNVHNFKWTTGSSELEGCWPTDEPAIDENKCDLFQQQSVGYETIDNVQQVVRHPDGCVCDICNIIKYTTEKLAQEPKMIFSAEDTPWRVLSPHHLTLASQAIFSPQQQRDFPDDEANPCMHTGRLAEPAQRRSDRKKHVDEGRDTNRRKKNPSRSDAQSSSTTRRAGVPELPDEYKGNKKSKTSSKIKTYTKSAAENKPSLTSRTTDSSDLIPTTRRADSSSMDTTPSESKTPSSSSQSTKRISAINSKLNETVNKKNEIKSKKSDPTAESVLSETSSSEMKSTSLKSDSFKSSAPSSAASSASRESLKYVHDVPGDRMNRRDGYKQSDESLHTEDSLSAVAANSDSGDDAEIPKDDLSNQQTAVDTEISNMSHQNGGDGFVDESPSLINAPKYHRLDGPEQNDRSNSPEFKPPITPLSLSPPVLLPDSDVGPSISATDNGSQVIRTDPHQDALRLKWKALLDSKEPVPRPHLIQLDADDTLIPTSEFVKGNWLDSEPGDLPEDFRRSMTLLDDEMVQFFNQLHSMVVLEAPAALESDNSSDSGLIGSLPGDHKLADRAADPKKKNYVLSVVIITNATRCHVTSAFSKFLPKVMAFLTAYDIQLDDLICSARDLWGPEFPFDRFYEFWKPWTLEDILKDFATTPELTVLSIGDDEPEREATAYVAAEAPAVVKGVKVVKMKNQPKVDCLVLQLKFINANLRRWISATSSFDIKLDIQLSPKASPSAILSNFNNYLTVNEEVKADNTFSAKENTTADVSPPQRLPDWDVLEVVEIHQPEGPWTPSNVDASFLQFLIRAEQFLDLYKGGNPAGILRLGKRILQDVGRDADVNEVINVFVSDAKFYISEGLAKQQCSTVDAIIERVKNLFEKVQRHPSEEISDDSMSETDIVPGYENENSSHFLTIIHGILQFVLTYPSVMFDKLRTESDSEKFANLSSSFTTVVCCLLIVLEPHCLATASAVENSGATHFRENKSDSNKEVNNDENSDPEVKKVENVDNLGKKTYKEVAANQGSPDSEFADMNGSGKAEIMLHSGCDNTKSASVPPPSDFADELVTSPASVNV